MSNTYFISDFHFGHYDSKTQKGIITFERTQFDTIEQHDEAIIKWCKHYAERWNEGDILWFLGDFGDISKLWVFNYFTYKGINCYFMLGNHDHEKDIPEIEKFVTKVYKYPTYLSQKLVISHFPVAVYEDSINVHGHLHSSKLQDINHINASLDVVKWIPVSINAVAGTWAKLPKFNRRFLYEPWAENYQFTQKRNDVIVNLDGKIDLSASRLLQKINNEERQKNKDPYNPYTGGLNVL